MTSRERILCSLNHEEPDKVPIDFGGVHTSIHKNIHRQLLEYYDFKPYEAPIQEIVQQIVYPDERLIEKYQADVIGVYPRPSSNGIQNFVPKNDEIIDEWGNTYIKPKDGYYYDIKTNVMRDFSIEDLENYNWPDPSDKARADGLRDEVINLRKNTDKAIILFSASWGLWENLWLQRGFEQAYVDIGININFVEKFWDKFLWWNKEFWNNMLEEVGDLIDVVQIGDDLGGQRGPLFNPEIYRNKLKPRHIDLISSIKEKTNAKVYFHSCGDVHWAIEDFIDSGIDILNPVQLNADGMDSKTLKKEFGDRICFWGGGCNTDVLLKGSMKDVELEVGKRIEDLAPGGGYVFASIHNIQSNCPPENLAAMYETAVKLRNYH
jgi:uroporphyrinogen decarboxylase